MDELVARFHSVGMFKTQLAAETAESSCGFHLPRRHKGAGVGNLVLVWIAHSMVAFCSLGEVIKVQSV